MERASEESNTVKVHLHDLSRLVKYRDRMVVTKTKYYGGWSGDFLINGVWERNPRDRWLMLYNQCEYT